MINSTEDWFGYTQQSISWLHKNQYLLARAHTQNTHRFVDENFPAKSKPIRIPLNPQMADVRTFVSHKFPNEIHGQIWMM